MSAETTLLSAAGWTRLEFLTYTAYRWFHPDHQHSSSKTHGFTTTGAIQHQHLVDSGRPCSCIPKSTVFPAVTHRVSS